MTIVDFDTNLLTGVLPSFIGSINALNELYMNNNLFSRTVPLSYSKFFLIVNVPYGVILCYFVWLVDNMTSVGFFYLYRNLLTGSLPKLSGLSFNSSSSKLYVNHI